MIFKSVFPHGTGRISEIKRSQNSPLLEETRAHCLSLAVSQSLGILQHPEASSPSGHRLSRECRHGDGINY